MASSFANLTVITDHGKRDQGAAQRAGSNLPRANWKSFRRRKLRALVSAMFRNGRGLFAGMSVEHNLELGDVLWLWGIMRKANDKQ